MKKQDVFSQQFSPQVTDSVWVSAYDVIWACPSTYSRDSMPLGDGDTGLNVWVEERKGLSILVGRSDTDKHNKLCQIQVSTEPNIFSGKDFSQELSLEEGIIRIRTDRTQINLWIDASVNDMGCGFLHLTGTTIEPVTVYAELALWRNDEVIRDLNTRFGDMKNNDLVLDIEDAIARCHYHPKYGFEHACVVGCELAGEAFGRVADTLLATRERVFSFDLMATILAEDVAMPKTWYDRLKQCKALYTERDSETHYSNHKNWWQKFWSRSRIEVSNTSISRRINSQYVLQRYLFACSSRGLLPSLFNGSVFRTEIEKEAEVAFSWVAENKTDADLRPWQSDYMGQNTRHQFWPLLASGDYDLLEPLVRLIRGRLKFQLKETWETMGHTGGFTPEKFTDRGFAYHPSDLAPLPESARLGRQSESWENEFWHLQYHFLPTIEFLALFIDTYIHNQDQKFFHEVVLPCLDMCVDFYDAHYPDKDANGKRLFYPAGTAESYGKARSGYHELPQCGDVTNPVSEIAGLRYVLAKAVAIDEASISPARKRRLEEYLNEIPDVPEKVFADTKLLAPAERYSPGLLCEAAELYAVWPFRQYTLYANESRWAVGRQSFFTRRISLDGSVDIQPWETGGWYPAGLCAATLGLGKEAARILELNYSDTLPTISIINNIEYQERPTKPRFEGFWNHPHMDGIPDFCHAGVSMNLLQHMLLQWDDQRIYLLPAWESSWDVSFKLHAPFNTQIECVFKDGRIKSLKVTPESRMKDLVDCQSLDFQIKNILSIRANDQNGKFNLPCMPDGLLRLDDLIYRPILKPWLEKYSQSVFNIQPYPVKLDYGYAFFKNHYLYLHVLDKQPVIQLPVQHFKPVKIECLTGGELTYTLDQQTLFLDLTDCHEDVVTIIRLTADQPIQNIQVPCYLQGSYSASSCLSEPFAAAKA
jgi:alpha-L-fucosidase 2